MPVPITIPNNIAEYVRRIWPNDKTHAAKQVVCWLDSEVYPHDLNAQVDMAIAIGRIAERLQYAGANAFMAEVTDYLN